MDGLLYILNALGTALKTSEEINAQLRARIAELEADRGD